jgi:hypothetical protein
MSILRLNTQDAAVSEEARLEALGIDVVSEVENPAIYAEFIEIGRHIAACSVQTIGLWPANPTIGIPALAVHIGLALADITSSTVAFVDANVRYPAARQLLKRRELKASTKDDELDFTTLWLRGMLAVLIPQVLGSAGEGLARLKATLEEGRSLFGHMLVDLTGFEHIGDHLSAMELLDGVSIVAIPKRTRVERLLEMQHEIGPQKLMGCILTG